MLFAIAQMAHMYYLSFYFQAVRDTDAATAGIRGLPYGMMGTAGILLSGATMSFTGYYVPMMWVGCSIFTAGACLLHTLEIGSSMGEYLGYELFTGFGFGLTEQVPFIAVQVVFSDDDMPVACALVIFSRCLGSAIGLSLAENLFLSALKDNLSHITGINATAILDAGAADFATVVAPAALESVKGAFNSAVMKVFLLPIAAGAVSLVLSFGMERLRMVDEEVPGQTTRW
jgi:hypothetical protein